MAGTFLKVRLRTAGMEGFKPVSNDGRQKPDRSESGPCLCSDGVSKNRLPLQPVAVVAGAFHALLVAVAKPNG
jgi:hypothetical protein